MVVSVLQQAESAAPTQPGDQDEMICIQGEELMTLDRRRAYRRSLLTLLFVGALCIGRPAISWAGGGIATGDTSGKRIAFSNSYAGNSFRQVMIKSFESM